MRSEAETARRHSPPVGWQLASRTAAALLGGYCFVWGVATLGTALGVQLGLPYGEAQMLLYLLAFLVFAAVVCWAFHVRSLWRLWTILLGGGVLMTGLGWLLAGR